MEDLNVQFRVAVLTVPDVVAPEQFPSWLRREALEIQESCAANSFVTMSLFLPTLIRAGITVKKLDALMQTITDRYKNIYRVDLVVVEDPPNAEEIEFIQSDAEKDFANLLNSVAQIQAEKIRKSRLH